MLNHLRRATCLSASLALLACAPTSRPMSQAEAIKDVQARPNSFASYPQADRTYLSFSKGHGFQVNHLRADGRAWLWYPGNKSGVPEEYKVQTSPTGTALICWRHPTNSYNPVTKTRGGDFACQPLDFAQRTIIAELPGDPFKLASGQVPYPLERCTAPNAFSFDRKRFGC